MKEFLKRELVWTLVLWFLVLVEGVIVLFAPIEPNPPSGRVDAPNPPSGRVEQ